MSNPSRTFRGRGLLPGLTLGALAAGALALLFSIACHSTPKTPKATIDENIESMRAAIAKAVADPQKVAALDQEVDRLVRLLQEMNASTILFSRRIQALNSKYEATEAEFGKLFEHFEQDRVRIRDEVVDVHFAMLAQTNAAEWKQISDHEKEALRAAGSIDVGK